MFFAREETPRLNAHKNPPSRVVTRQPKRLTRAPDACPEKKMSAMESDPTQAAKREKNKTHTHTNISAQKNTKSAVGSIYILKRLFPTFDSLLIYEFRLSKENRPALVNYWGLPYDLHILNISPHQHCFIWFVFPQICTESKLWKDNFKLCFCTLK